MTLHCSAKWQETLCKLKLATFDQIWDYPITWIEAPNQNRGGWSGVGCVTLLLENTPVTLFIKKQCNHTKRTFRHPLQGEPTFAREFQAIRFLQTHGVVVPDVVFYGQRRTKEGQQAILVTEVLSGFQSLDKLDKSQLSLFAQRALINSVAQTVRKMHALGVQHRALYTKHIFVKSREGGFDVALIDLEKSRHMIWPSLQANADLVTLNYRTQGWSRHARYLFYKYYLGRQQLGFCNRIMLRWIMAKSAQKVILSSQRVGYGSD